jgi:hypothetical protein
VLLCVVHPSTEVRARVAAAFPDCAASATAASPEALPVAPGGASVVVLLDPAHTAPADVLVRYARRPHLVSISDLRVAAGEVGVDHVLPLRRVDEHAVRRLLVLLDLLPALAGTPT